MGKRQIPKVVCALALLFGAGASGLQAQSIHGRVLVVADTVGIEGALVMVVDSTGKTLTAVVSDSTGGFNAFLDDPGRYRVVATRLGYRTSDAMILLQAEEIVDLQVRMAEQAIPLDPILVVARRRIQRGTLDEFYDRMARYKDKDRGYFIDRQEIEESGAASVAMLLNRVPGVYPVPVEGAGYEVQMRRPGAYCTPTLYVDGRPQGSYRMPDLEDLEGMEIYRGRFEWVDGYGSSDCGVILAWRKSDWGEPFNWKRGLAFSGLAVFFLLFVF